MALKAEQLRCLLFIGEENAFADWSEKAVAYMHTKNWRGRLLGPDASYGEAKYHIQAEVLECLDEQSIKMLQLECKRIGSEERID